MASPKISARAHPAEQQRIAQMLHDGPCQVFTSAHLLAVVLLRDAEAGIIRDVGLYRELADSIKAGVNELHEVMTELRASKGPLEKGEPLPRTRNQP